IVVGRDPLEPLLGSLRTALFLGLGADADSGRVDLLLGVVVLSCCAVRQILLFVAHGVPLFRKVVAVAAPFAPGRMIVTGAARAVVSTLTPSGSGIKALAHGGPGPALAGANRALRSGSNRGRGCGEFSADRKSVV